MDYKIIHGLSMVDTWPINGDLLFHVGPFWKKWDHVPNPFEIGLGVFVLEKNLTGPKRIWNLTSAYPFWSMLEKWGQVPNPFKIILTLFILKGAKLFPNGFGTWPLLFHFGPCWKNGVRFQTLFTNHVVYCSFWKGPNWSQRGLEPDLCFSTLVHVGKNGVKFQTLF